MSSAKKVALGGAMDALKKVTGHWLFWVIVALITFLLLWKLKNKAQTWWRNLKRVNRADTGGHQVNAQDVAKVKQIARALIESDLDDDAALNQALGLNASEFILLAEEYRAMNDGTSLLEQLTKEWWLTDVQEALKARLNEVGVAKMAIPRIEIPEPESTAAEFPTTMTYEK